MAVAENRTLISALQYHSIEEDIEKARRLLANEFRGLNDVELYENAFSRLILADKTSLLDQTQRQMESVTMIGTDQRDRIVRKLRTIGSEFKAGDRILDIGCGDGETAKHFLNAARNPVRLSLLDPNQAYVTAYSSMVQSLEYQHEVEATAISGMDAFAMNEDPHIGLSSENLFDHVFLLHSVYFASDLPRFLCSLLDRMRPGASATILFADEDAGYTGKMVRNYISVHDINDDYVGEVERRHSLFGVGGEKPEINRVTKSLTAGLGRNDLVCTFAERQMSRIFGGSLRDIMASAFITGLIGVGDQSINAKIDAVATFLLGEHNDLNLCVENSGRRYGLLSVLQPQFLITLQKTDGR